MYFREWAREVKFRKGTMLPLSQISMILQSSNPGYATVYMFDEDAAMEIRQQDNSVGFGRFKVYAESIAIDLDNGVEQLVRAEAALAVKGWGYQVWDSGNKGFHIYIPTVLMGDVNLPYSHQKIVEELNIDADLSLYQHGRLLSLPGRPHHKTGRKKTLLKTVEGPMPDVKIVEKPEITFDLGGDGGLSDMRAGLFKLMEMAANEPSPGNRHTRLWSAALNLARAGLSHGTVLELTSEINRLWTNVKPQEEVTSAVEQAFRQR